MKQEIWQKILSPNEEIKYSFTVGKRYQILGLIIGIIIGLFLFYFFKPLGIVVILMSLFYFGWYVEIANAYVFTNKRVLIYRGWINTKLISIDYKKITDIIVEEPFLDKLITKTGCLAIDTAGTAFEKITLEHIENPYEIKKKLDEIREKINE